MKEPQDEGWGKKSEAKPESNKKKRKYKEMATQDS
jgi:hypothetical protein